MRSRKLITGPAAIRLMVTDVNHPADAYTPGGERRPDRPDAGGRILRQAGDDPEGALSLLRATVGARDDGRPAGSIAGRREAACALADIARVPEHFEEAAMLLLRLAAAEGGTARSGAGEIFAGLFVNVPYVATTKAGAGERAALLAELLDGDDGRIRLLALSACDTALRTLNVVQVDCKSGQPAIFTGRIVGKELDAHKKVLALLTGRLGRMAPDEGREAVRLILERAADLARHGEMSCETADAVRMLHEMDMADKGRQPEIAKAAADVCARRSDKRGEAAWGSLLAEVAGGAGRGRSS